MPEIKYYTRDEVFRLLQAIPSVRDKAIWTVAFWRGLRASEVALLRMEDYRKDSRRLFVRRLKGGLSAEYPVSDMERLALQRWLQVRGTDPGPLFVVRGGKPPSRQHLHNLMKEYCAKAGLDPAKAHFHTLRHSCAVYLVDKGLDLLAVKDWLGHTAISSTTIYAQIRNPTRDAKAREVYEGEEAGEKGGEPKVKVDWSKDRRDK